MKLIMISALKLNSFEQLYGKYDKRFLQECLDKAENVINGSV